MIWIANIDPPSGDTLFNILAANVRQRRLAAWGSTERCRTALRGRPARLESVWRLGRNAAPWYGWFCAAF